MTKRKPTKPQTFARSAGQRTPRRSHSTASTPLLTGLGNGTPSRVLSTNEKPRKHRRFCLISGVRRQSGRQDSNLRPLDPQSSTLWADNSTNQGFSAIGRASLYRCLYRLDGKRVREASQRGGRKARKSKPKTFAPTLALVEPTTDFAQQVAGIMALLLTDAEKTECIRRLLAAQPKGV